MFRTIRTVGPCLTIHSLCEETDHPDGLLAFYHYVTSSGFFENEIDFMVKVNGAKLLRLK
jgi:hypothetical protein